MTKAPESAIGVFMPPGPHVLSRLGKNVLVGRSDAAHIRVEDPLVSTLHAVISAVGDHWRIRDLGSRNGTRVNGRKVDEADLARGDVIAVGDTSFRFEPTAPPPSTPRGLLEAIGPGALPTIVMRVPDLADTAVSAALQAPAALSALVNLSSLIDLATTREQLVHDATSQIADVVAARHASVWNHVGGVWRREANWGEDSKAERTRDDMIALALAKRQAAASTLEGGTRYAATVPLAARKADLGAVYLERATPFTRDELELLSIFATKLALALENDALTEQLRGANAELTENNARLEREVSRRTAEVQRLSEQRRDLLGMVAHDVRGALSFVTLLGDVDAVKRRGVGDKTALEVLEQIGARARRTIDLLSGLLDAEALAEGSIRVRQEPVDVAAVARSLLGPLKMWAEGRKLELSVKSPPRPVIVTADAARLEQVLQNLVANALRHTHEGRITISVEEVGRRAVVAVSDTGTGIAKEALARLFKPFARTDETSKGSRPRVGLGLAIANRLVSLMGGAISVESELCKGTTVRFDLPLPQTPS